MAIWGYKKKTSKDFERNVSRPIYCKWPVTSYGGLAQLVERPLRMRKVAGSIPAISTYKVNNIRTFARLLNSRTLWCLVWPILPSANFSTWPDRSTQFYNER